MTYKEWFTAMGSRFMLSDDDVKLILVNQASLIPSETADVDVKIAKRALCTEFAVCIPLHNVSEGGYSISWNWDAIKYWYEMTCKELGIQSIAQPKITDRSNIW
jgi:hypothetical protein